MPRTLRAGNVEPLALPNELQPCPQADATRELAAEVKRLRITVQAGIRQVQPACNAVRGLCAWIKKYGPWILGAAPGVLVAIGAISPNAATALKAALAALGGGG